MKRTPRKSKEVPRTNIGDIPNDIIREIASYNPGIAVALSLVNKRLHLAVACDEKLWYRLMNYHYYPCKYVKGQDWRKRIINIVNFPPPMSLFNAVSYDDVKALIHRGHSVSFSLDSHVYPTYVDDDNQELLSIYARQNVYTDQRIRGGRRYIFPIIIKHLIYPNPEVVQAMIESEQMIEYMNGGEISMPELFSYLGQVLADSVERRVPVDKLEVLKCYEVLFSVIDTNEIYQLYSQLAEYIKGRYKITGKFKNLKYLRYLFGDWSADRISDTDEIKRISNNLVGSCISIGDSESVRYLLSIDIPMPEMEGMSNRLLRPITVDIFDLLMENGYRLRRYPSDPDYVSYSTNDYINIKMNSNGLISIIRTNDIELLDHIIDTATETSSDEEYTLLLSLILTTIVMWEESDIRVIRHLYEDRGARLQDRELSDVLDYCLGNRLVVARYFREKKVSNYDIRINLMPDRSIKLTERDMKKILREYMRLSKEKLALSVFIDEHRNDVERFKILIDLGLNVSGKYGSSGKSLYENLMKANRDLNDLGIPGGSEREKVLAYLKSFVKE